MTQWGLYAFGPSKKWLSIIWVYIQEYRAIGDRVKKCGVF